VTVGRLESLPDGFHAATVTLTGIEKRGAHREKGWKRTVLCKNGAFLQNGPHLQ